MFGKLIARRMYVIFRYDVRVFLRSTQGCSPKKEVEGRLKQDLDKDLQLHRILILLY